MENKNFEQINRPHVEALDSIIGKPFKVLDDGFIRLIDYMGSDESIVQAARVSYGKGTKQISEDSGLIRYLMRHLHTTPFEMCEIKLHIRVPMDCWRQWIRHRTANVNEYSTRYSIAIDSMQKTKDTQWRMQSRINKQGSFQYLDSGTGHILTAKEEQLQKYVWKLYQERIECGVSKEQARKDLPLSTYTEAYWKVDLHNLFHFLRLRMDSHAQEEIRSYANTIANEIIKLWCPLAWSAFQDYQLNSLRLSNIEVKIINLIMTNDLPKLQEYLKELRFIDQNGMPTKNRERTELEKKLSELNFNIPW